MSVVLPSQKFITQSAILI